MSSTGSNFLFGWELLYNLVKKDIKDSKDLATVLVHFSLLKANFRCVCIGENNNVTEPGSELLPDGWNAKNDVVLTYVRNNVTYTLRSTVANNDRIIFNLLQSESLKVSNVVISLEDVKDFNSSLIENTASKFNEIYAAVKKDLINYVIDRETKNANSQTPESSSSSPTLSRGINRRNSFQWFHEPVGTSDLDPLRSGGGGMLFDPFERSRRRDYIGLPEPPLPSGARPPGARFDPFGPPDNRIRPARRFPYPDFPNPDIPDHDMYM